MARLRHMLRAGACALLVAGAGGCGGEADPPQTPAAVTPTDPPNLVTGAYLDDQVAAQGGAAPVEVTLRFWRDLQYGNFVRAYDRLGRALREAVPYPRFVEAFDRAKPLFMYRPRVQSVEEEEGVTTVYLLIQNGPRPAVTDPPASFNLRREGAQWRIVTDPRNVLGTPAGP